MTDVTRLLSALDQGDTHAADRLLPLVYDELRKLAAHKLAQEKPGQTLDATALVHEAYVRLVDVDNAQRWNGRGHFFAAAAEAMRRILVERARGKGRGKRGGDFVRAALDPAELPGHNHDDQLLAIHDGIDRLAIDDPQAAELVKLRYFAGMSLEEAAGALGLPRSSAYAHWAYAKASLRIHLAMDEES